MIFDKDYINLSEEERQQYAEYKIANKEYDDNGNPVLFKQWFPKLQPNFIYKHDSLFPNHEISCLDIDENYESFKTNFENFKQLINDKTIGEREILNFIKIKKLYIVISSLLKGYDFGHHERFIFPEFQLSNDYAVDYLIIGKASGGYQFLFVELENVNGRITNQKGEYSTVVNKGIKQVKDWKRWIPQNFNSIQQTLLKYKGPNRNFKEEFYRLDLDRLNFAVVAGRRFDYKELTYKIRREINKNGEQVNIFHYDHLVDYTELVLKQKAW